MSERQLSASTVQSLSKKLDEFSEVLTTDEHAVLLGLLGLAGSTLEQSHAGMDTEGLTNDKALVIQPAGRLPALSEGLKGAFGKMPIGDPAGPVSDSVGVGWLCVSWSKDYKESIQDKVINPGRVAATIPGLRQYR